MKQSNKSSKALEKFANPLNAQKSVLWRHLLDMWIINIGLIVNIIKEHSARRSTISRSRFDFKWCAIFFTLQVQLHFPAHVQKFWWSVLSALSHTNAWKPGYNSIKQQIYLLIIYGNSQGRLHCPVFLNNEILSLGVLKHTTGCSVALYWKFCIQPHPFTNNKLLHVGKVYGYSGFIVFLVFMFLKHIIDCFFLDKYLTVQFRLTEM